MTVNNAVLMSAPKKKTRDSKSTVKVELEKLEEKEVVKRGPVCTVSPETLAAIKNQTQVEEDVKRERELTLASEEKEKLKNRLLFYGGVAAAVGVCYLVHRYFSGGVPVPAEKYALELANGINNNLPK